MLSSKNFLKIGILIIAGVVLFSQPSWGLIFSNFGEDLRQSQWGGEKIVAVPIYNITEQDIETISQLTGVKSIGIWKDRPQIIEKRIKVDMNKLIKDLAHINPDVKAGIEPSIFDLRDALRKQGIEVEVIRVEKTDGELVSLFEAINKMPFIMRLERNNLLGDRGYIVVTEVYNKRGPDTDLTFWMEEDVIDYYNANGAFQDSIGDQDYRKEWDGYVLYLKTTEATQIVSLHLEQYATATYSYFSNPDFGLHQETGLPYDNIAITKDGQIIRLPYTSITNIGLKLASDVGAYLVGEISKDITLARIEKAIESLKKMEVYKVPRGRYRGYRFYFNYYDLETLTSRDKFISSVDTAWLVAGLIVAREAFPELTHKIEPIIDGINFGFFYDEERNLMLGGYSYEGARDWSPTDWHYGMLNSEVRMITYLAIGKGDISDEEILQHLQALDKELTQYKGIRVSRSWGGGAFEHGMPPLFVDEVGISPLGFGVNLIKAFYIQMLQAKELGYPIWGESPSTDEKYGYDEFGSPSGKRPYPSRGVITPHASFLALQILPEEVKENLEKIALLYPGAYSSDIGFADVINTNNNEVIFKYLALNQGMSYLASVNALTDGAIQRLFGQSPEGQRIAGFISEIEFFTTTSLREEIINCYSRAKDYIRGGNYQVGEILLDYIQDLNERFSLEVIFENIEAYRVEVDELRQTELETLYSQAEEQITAKDLTGAETTLIQLLGIDIDYLDALKRLEYVREQLKEAPELPYISLIDFDRGRIGDYVLSFGAYYTSPNRVEESVINYNNERGGVLHAIYNVPEYGGLWFKLADLEIEEYEYLSLDLKAPDEKINELKLEIKSGGRMWYVIIRDIPFQEWRTYKIPLFVRGFNIPRRITPDEFVITIEGWKLPWRQRRGTLLVDNIRFWRKN